MSLLTLCGKRTNIEHSLPRKGTVDADASPPNEAGLSGGVFNAHLHEMIKDGTAGEFAAVATQEC
jgi:hypothetical protein